MGFVFCASTNHFSLNHHSHKPACNCVSTNLPLPSSILNQEIRILAPHCRVQ